MGREEASGALLLGINLLILLDATTLGYGYYFTERLYLFMYPGWFLAAEAATGLAGIVLGIFLLKGKSALRYLLPFQGLLIAALVVLRAALQ